MKPVNFHFDMKTVCAKQRFWAILIFVLAGVTIACFYEKGQKDPYEMILFERFSLKWLTGE